MVAWTLSGRDGEVPSKKEQSSYFEEHLVVKFLVKRSLVPQMRNFSPTLLSGLERVQGDYLRCDPKSTVIVARMSHRKWRETKQQLI